MTHEPDQREYFRIDDRLTIDYRRVDDREFERLESIIRYNPSYVSDRASEMRFLDEVMSQQKAEEKELYAYLKVIERKLDAVLDLLTKEKQDVLYKLLTTRINISGSGVKFVSNEKLLSGERLELRLSLPVAPFPKICTLCEVVRVESSSPTEMEEWHVAVKFLMMNDADRDVLINYVFTKEREKLRSDKGLDS
ncbi:MAG TPA: PilZ domain-containing protein [Syntrophorhabdaceae bacterium]|jgi:hypothetical protein